MQTTHIVLAASFQREVKPLAKKFKSLPQEIRALLQQLRTNPQLGTPLGKGCYKIRLAVRSKGGSKSGGMRVVTYVVVRVIVPPAEDQTTIYLASIYDKSERENISDTQLKTLISAIDTAAKSI